jgi:hypothetical protein
MVRTLSVGGNPDAVTLGPPGVWVGDRSELTRVDPRTGSLAIVPGVTTPIAVGANDLAAAVYTRPDTIGIVDPTSLRVGSTFTLGGSIAGLAYGAGWIWVLDASGVLTRVDAATGAVTGVRTLGSFGFAVVAGNGAIWVTGRTTDPDAGPLGSLHTMHTQPVVWRVDPLTLSVVATIQATGNCDALAASDDILWAACGTARRIDPLTDRLLDAHVFARNGIAVGDGAAWALDADGVVVRLDARNGRELGRLAVPPGSEGLAAGDGVLWISDPHLHDHQTKRGAGTLLRIALSSG